MHKTFKGESGVHALRRTNDYVHSLNTLAREGGSEFAYIYLRATTIGAINLILHSVNSAVSPGYTSLDAAEHSIGE